ncbi:LysR family glycine cleavage system transcriptional activator [Rhizobium sp. SG_E_25_P2]|uniref:LysR substrate-binding domain-containing protein n=1 Tax=Rhizobium sp. SG_E_25_P2 TaxID=2879942 RepID=UPI002476933E|nr:LysR substrate-binding domain-containing protein [Rhizobium sp. SG_E_25_P2]MDH6267190.1 LysR family glycine cleavage system transcriptional activator [Rhizobium sp. SG_E_25_P2]
MRRLPALTAMKIFEVVGQTRSFTRAAERLNLTQSAVSRQVRNLEEQLGEALFIRRHHDLELTESGAELYATLQDALHNVELTVRSIMEKSSGARLRLNAPPTFARRWLMPRLPSLRAAMPDVDISISTDLQDNLGERSLLDCAIRFGDGEWPLMQVSHLMNERHVAVCAPSLLHGASAITGADLSRFTFLHVLASSNQRYLTWRHWLDAAGLAEVDTRGGLEFDLLDLAIEAAVNGMGVTVADRHMITPQLEQRLLTTIMDVEVPGHQSYWLVTRRERGESDRLLAFKAWLDAEIACETTTQP